MVRASKSADRVGTGRRGAAGGGARQERSRAARRGGRPLRRGTRFDWLANLRQRRVAAAVALTVALLFVISMFLGFGVGGFSPAAFRGRDSVSGQQGGGGTAPSAGAASATPSQGAGAGSGGSDTVGNVLPSLPKFPPAPLPPSPGAAASPGAPGPGTPSQP